MSYTRGPLPRYWHSIDTLTHGPLAPQAAGGSAAWPTANLAIYVPVAVERRVVVKQLWYANAATATGNYDLGLYDAGGTAILRKGSTAKGTANDETVWNCTDTTIAPGIYYLALNASNNTDTYVRFAPAAPIAAAMGVYTEAVGSVTLPATATFAVNQSLAYIPILGMFLDTRVT